jgi:glycosyltransferase involved in cell wall biosynthesis
VATRVAIVVSHPIQYQAPLFVRLAERAVVDLEVLFLSHHGVEASLDPGFGREVRFDVPLTEGYPHRFVANWSPTPSIDTFAGLVNVPIARQLAGGRYDAVLVHGYAHFTDWLVASTARVLGMPYLLRGETLDTPPDGRATASWRRKRAILAPLVAGAHQCLAIGLRSARYWLEMGARPSQIGWAPYSVDNERFVAGAEQARADRDQRLTELGLDPERPVALFAAKLDPGKRVLDFVAAGDRLDGRASFVVVGDGAQRGELDALLADRPWLRSVGFANQSEMPGWYGLADIYVLASASDGGWRETWGLGVNEAMASGAVPVVSDQVGCAPDLVDGGAGCVVAARDPDAIADAIVSLLDRTRRDAMRAEGRRRLDRYSLDATAAGIEQAVLSA